MAERGGPTRTIRTAPRRKRRLRLGRIVLALFLLGGIGAAAAYGPGLLGQYLREDTQRIVPVIRADATPVRVRPTDPGGMEVPHRGMSVLEGMSADVTSVIPSLRPPPEPPQRPATPLATVPIEPSVAPLPPLLEAPNGVGGPEVEEIEGGEGPPIAAVPVPPVEREGSAPGASTAAPPTDVPVQPTAAEPVRRPDRPAEAIGFGIQRPGEVELLISRQSAALPPTAPEPLPASAAPAPLPPPTAPATSAPVPAAPIPETVPPAEAEAPSPAPDPVDPGPELASAPEPAPPAPAPAGGYAVQVAAIMEGNPVADEWRRFQSQFPDLLGGLQMTTQSVEVNGRIFVRILAGAMPQTQAQALCRSLNARGADCIVRAL